VIVQVKQKRYEKLTYFDQYLALYISKTVHDTAIVTMENE